VRGKVWARRGNREARFTVDAAYRVKRNLAPFGIQPHRSKSYKLSTDPFLVEKLRDVVGLHLNPPNNALVLCVDEKSQVQALDVANGQVFT
jgi:putative transposase